MKFNKKKNDQLGVAYGTACSKLRKYIMFDLVNKLNLHICFQCGLPIKNVNEFSIEHKTPWLDSDNPTNLFFDLNNIGFSHLKCNSKNKRNAPQRNKKYKLGEYRGIRYNEKTKMFDAFIFIKGKRIVFGSFVIIDDAIKCHDNNVIEMFGDTAKTINRQ